MFSSSAKTILQQGTALIPSAKLKIRETVKRDYKQPRLLLIVLAIIYVLWYIGTHARRIQTRGRTRPNRRTDGKTDSQNPQGFRRLPRHHSWRSAGRHSAPR